MNLVDYTIQSGFLPHLKCADLTEGVTRLVDTLVAADEVGDPAGLVSEVMRREAEGSTAVGGGLVIPHARYEGVRSVRIAVATLAEPLAITTLDGQPVDLVILLVGPPGDPRQMLRVLARLARLVRQGGPLEDLRKCATIRDLQSVLTAAG